MAPSEFTRLGLRILDEQLVDADGRRCGRVEDLELDAVPGLPARVTGFLCGATAWQRRLPQAMAELFPGDPRGLKRVPWDCVEKIDNEIELRVSEDQLQSAAEVEGAPLYLSQLLGSQVLDHEGRKLGRVHEVLAERPASADEATLWRVHSLLVGRPALLQRAGFSPLLAREVAEGRRPENMIVWEWVVERDELGRLRLGNPDDADRIARVLRRRRRGIHRS